MDDPTSTPRRPSRRWSVSVFGDVTWSGSWPTTRRLSAVSLFGDIDLDLRQPAPPPSGAISITAVAPFGDIEVVVPEGVDADVGGFTLFGSKKIALGESTSERMSLVHLRPFSLFGSIRIRAAER